VWLLHSELELSKVAVALLSLSASEAAVERSFSAQGNVHTKLRNRMEETSVQDEMFIKFNSRLLLPNSSAAASAAAKRVAKVVEEDEASSDSGSESDMESDESDAFLFAIRRRAPFAARGAAAAAAPDHEGTMELSSSDSDSDLESEMNSTERRTIVAAAEEEEEEKSAAAVPAALSGAARRAARRSQSVVFKDVDSFLAWFAQTRNLHSGSTINSDVHNDLQLNAGSKLPIANAPSTKELCNRLRSMLQPKPSAAAVATAASIGDGV